MYGNTQNRPAIKQGPCPEIEDSPHFRSGWERNVYRMLLRLGYQLVEYEPQRFSFTPPYRRCLDYLPDFTCVDPKGPRSWCPSITGAAGANVREGKDLIIEVKGRLDGQSKTRLMGFAKHYPHLVGYMLIITRTGDKCSKKETNGMWLRKHLPGAVVWDYDTLKRQAGRLCNWE